MKRLMAFITIVFALVWGIDHPVRAALFVSDFDSNMLEVRKFTDAGVPVPPIPFISGGPGLNGGEGLACAMVGSQGELFVASNGPTINIYDPATGLFLRTFATINNGQAQALSLSLDGLLLYAADPGNSRIDAFSTLDPNPLKLPIYSIITNASHDVRVGPDGYVYATNFDNSTGVLKFNADLSASSTFIPFGDNGLRDAAGMTFDKAGNLWVSNFPLNDPSGTSSVSEYDSNGNFERRIIDPNLLFGPLGLDVGPDGNIYVAVLGKDIVTEIDIANNYSLSTFIPMPSAGHFPKYLAFTENCVNVVPEPSTWAFGLALLGVCAGKAKARRRKRPRKLKERSPTKSAKSGQAQLTLGTRENYSGNGSGQAFARSISSGA